LQKNIPIGAWKKGGRRRWLSFAPLAMVLRKHGLAEKLQIERRLKRFLSGMVRECKRAESDQRTSFWQVLRPDENPCGQMASFEAGSGATGWPSRAQSGEPRARHRHAPGPFRCRTWVRWCRAKTTTASPACDS
jgi:hypothetical protein